MFAVKAKSPGEDLLLAQISDPHLALEGVRLRELPGKRVLGYLSWQRRRKRIHRPEVLAALIEELRRAAPDHLAVTGDLTNLGLPAEFRRAARWLAGLGPPDRVTVIPGNHDAYVPAPWETTLGLVAPYLAGDAADPASGPEELFPSLRRRGPAALIGLSTARPCGPFLAVGSLGERQLERLEELLAETRREGLARILLLHHPPLPGAIAWRKRLTDTRLLGEVLARRGVELILHGHAHAPFAGEVEAGGRAIPVFGLPSASDIGLHPGREARFHLYRLEPSGEGGWRLGLSVRRFRPADGGFETTGERTLLIPRQRD